jgi:hypothetical protein
MSSRPRARREMGVRHRWSGEPLLVTQSHFPSNAPRCRPSLLRAQIPVIGRGRAEWVKSTRGGASPPQCERITRSPRRRAATTAKLHVVPLVGAGGNYDLAVMLCLCRSTTIASLWQYVSAQLSCEKLGKHPYTRVVATMGVAKDPKLRAMFRRHIKCPDQRFVALAQIARKTREAESFANRG